MLFTVHVSFQCCRYDFSPKPFKCGTVTYRKVKGVMTPLTKYLNKDRISVSSLTFISCMEGYWIRRIYWVHICPGKSHRNSFQSLHTQLTFLLVYFKTPRFNQIHLKTIIESDKCNKIYQTMNLLIHYIYKMSGTWVKRSTFLPEKYFQGLSGQTVY